MNSTIPTIPKYSIPWKKNEKFNGIEGGDIERTTADGMKPKNTCMPMDSPAATNEEIEVRRSLETKEQLVQKIKEWVKMDNDIRILQKELLERKNEKKKISKELMEVMRLNEIDCFDIKDGQIVYSKTNIKKPITKKGLLNILSTYYNGDINKAVEMNKFIMDNREEVVKESIVRKIQKKT